MAAHPALTWNLIDRDPRDIEISADGPNWITPEWAWGDANGAGVRVCIVDSGVEADHPMVGPIGTSYALTEHDGVAAVVEVPHADTFGHGTACASIVRLIAPRCEIYSLRVLGANGAGGADALIAGLEWAVRQRFDVINLSLSTPRVQFKPALRDIADEAQFNNTIIVASAHNAKIESFPWRFSSVISVGSHAVDDSSLVLYNPAPPVEFFARGQAVPVAGLGGTTIRNTGNSFATPHVTGLCALMLSKHPQLTAFEVKAILYRTAANVHTLPLG
jgi:subtilisin family serine protease